MDTRNTIITQSFKLFLKEGYKEISINKIVETCHISKGAFYHHFESKDDLYTQVLDRFFFNYFQSSDFSYTQDLELSDKLHQFIVSFVTPYEELLELTERNDLILYFRFLFQAAAFHPLIKFKVNKHFYKKAYYLAILIKEQQDKGVITNNISIKEVARQLLSIVLGITILDGIYDASSIKKHLQGSIELYIQLLIK